MGRYSSVQAYADNNANMRSIQYDQAVGSAQAKAGPGMLFLLNASIAMIIYL